MKREHRIPIDEVVQLPGPQAKTGDDLPPVKAFSGSVDHSSTHQFDNIVGPAKSTGRRDSSACARGEGEIADRDLELERCRLASLQVRSGNREVRSRCG
jgi:hypothetical protein